MPPVSSPLLSPRNPAIASALWGAALLLGSLGTALAAPLPHISMEVKRTQTKTQDLNAMASNSNSSNSGSSGSSSKSSKPKTTPGVDTRSNEVYYVITLHNVGANTASNVEVDYSIYNRTTTNAQSGTTHTVDEIAGSETVDIPGNASKDVETNKVPHQQQQALTQKASKYGGGSSGPPTTTVQQVAGIWVVAKVGDAVIATYEDPPGIKAKMDAKLKKDSSGGGN